MSGVAVFLGRAVATGKRGVGVGVGVVVGSDVSVGCGSSVFGAGCAGVLVGAAGGRVLVGGAAGDPLAAVGGATCGWGLLAEQAGAMVSNTINTGHSELLRIMLTSMSDRIELIKHE